MKFRGVGRQVVSSPRRSGRNVPANDAASGWGCPPRPPLRLVGSSPIPFQYPHHLLRSTHHPCWHATQPQQRLIHDTYIAFTCADPFPPPILELFILFNHSTTKPLPPIPSKRPSRSNEFALTPFTMASVTSLDQDMKKLRLGRYTPQASNEARTWIEDILGERLPPGDLLDALKDGTVLCRYILLSLPPE